MTGYPKKQPRRPRYRSQTPQALLDVISQRDGHRCAWTGEDSDQLVPQHRQGGMGGRVDKHRASNVVWLNSIVNGLIESDPKYQAEAKRRGIKISNHDDPERVPVDHAVHGLVRLDDGGSVTPINPEGVPDELTDFRYGYRPPEGAPF